MKFAFSICVGLASLVAVDAASVQEHVQEAKVVESIIANGQAPKEAILIASIDATGQVDVAPHFAQSDDTQRSSKRMMRGEDQVKPAGSGLSTTSITCGLSDSGGLLYWCANTATCVSNCSLTCNQTNASLLYDCSGTCTRSCKGQDLTTCYDLHHNCCMSPPPMPHPNGTALPSNWSQVQSGCIYDKRTTRKPHYVVNTTTTKTTTPHNHSVASGNPSWGNNSNHSWGNSSSGAPATTSPATQGKGSVTTPAPTTSLDSTAQGKGNVTTTPAPKVVATTPVAPTTSLDSTAQGKGNVTTTPAPKVVTTTPVAPTTPAPKVVTTTPVDATTSLDSTAQGKGNVTTTPAPAGTTGGNHWSTPAAGATTAAATTAGATTARATTAGATTAEATTAGATKAGATTAGAK